MKDVIVITGGGSGMGLAAARQMDRNKIIVISGRTVAKLEKAVNELKELGYAIAVTADPRNGFLAGVDVLVDGGATTHQKEFKTLK